jgi:hypothetical protein
MDSPRVSDEIAAKLAALDPPRKPILDSVFIPVSGTNGAAAERVLADDGLEYISSPVDDWTLRPLGGAA